MEGAIAGEGLRFGETVEEKGFVEVDFLWTGDVVHGLKDVSNKIIPFSISLNDTKYLLDLLLESLFSFCNRKEIDFIIY